MSRGANMMARIFTATGLALLLLTAACARTSQVNSGETHFLACDGDSDCWDTQTCACGVCTRTCDGACDGELASCLPTGTVAACTSSDPAQVCLAACERDADCGGVGNGARCQLGRCELPEPIDPSCPPEGCLQLADCLVTLGGAPQPVPLGGPITVPSDDIDRVGPGGVEESLADWATFAEVLRGNVIAVRSGRTLRDASGAPSGLSTRLLEIKVNARGLSTWDEWASQPYWGGPIPWDEQSEYAGRWIETPRGPSAFLEVPVQDGGTGDGLDPDTCLARTAIGTEVMTAAWPSEHNIVWDWAGLEPSGDFRVGPRSAIFVPASLTGPVYTHDGKLVMAMGKMPLPSEVATFDDLADALITLPCHWKSGRYETGETFEDGCATCTCISGDVECRFPEDCDP